MTSTRSSWRWPLIIIGMLVANAVASGILIAISSADDGHAVEPDYYAKAVAWDDEMAQQRVNRDLGWQLTSELAEADGVVTVTATLRDDSGAQVTGASAELETFHRARARDRLQLTLHEEAPGVYRARWRSTRHGLWELRYRFARGDLLFTDTSAVRLESGR